LIRYYDETRLGDIGSVDRKREEAFVYLKAFIYVDQKRISRIHQTSIYSKKDKFDLVIEFDEQLNLLPYTTYIGTCLVTSLHPLLLRPIR
jgi:hypothetical protein